MALLRNSANPLSLRIYLGLVQLYSSGTRNTNDRTATEPDTNCDRNAYEVLGVPTFCSEARIRAAFRDLVKVTHPDLQPTSSLPSNTARFIRIVEAYEILSDPPKRAQYDAHLRSRRSEDKSVQYKGKFYRTTFKPYEEYTNTEVVQWLTSYRARVQDMVTRRELGKGSGLEEQLKGELQSALKTAYFGSNFREYQGLPDCFEAEERAQPEVPDVLHLVSGRELFGFVREVQSNFLENPKHSAPSLPLPNDVRFQSSCGLPYLKSGERQHSRTLYHFMQRVDAEESQKKICAFVDLELHLFGKIIARSTRIPNCAHGGADGILGNDCICIYSCSEQGDRSVLSEDTNSEPLKLCNTADRENLSNDHMLLGTIHGLSTPANGKVCAVHRADGRKTHLILQHRTPLVKHMQWFNVEDETAHCVCRCRRAQILPSKYWLFEPRAATHNVGGWYIETFSQKRDCRRMVDAHGNPESGSATNKMTWCDSESLHPAMYIMAAAYRTLDDEAAQRWKRSIPTLLKAWINFDSFSFKQPLWWIRNWHK